MGAIPEKTACCVKVYRPGGVWGGGRCSNRAKIEVDGKYYCATHDPAAEARRKAKSDAYYEAGSQARNAVRAADSARGKALESLRKALRQEASWTSVEAAGVTMLAAEDDERKKAAAHAALQPGAKK